MIFDTFELLDTGPVQLRFKVPDGTFYREVRNPGDSLNGLPADVRTAILVHWTPERVSAWQTGQASSETELQEMMRPTTRAELVDAVVAERTRRLALGFDYNFGGERGVHHIGTAPDDMRGWDEVTQLATALIQTGDYLATIDIVTNTGPCTITAEEWPSILIAAGAFRQPIWAASFGLQALDTIPADFADDNNWPEHSHSA